MTEKELKTIVLTNIKRYRDLHKWTQAQLAEKLDISVNFVSDIENGKKFFSMGTLVKLASVLNIEPYELFKPANTPPPGVSEILYRYNDDVVQCVNESLQQVYNYYQANISKNPAKPQ